MNPTAFLNKRLLATAFLKKLLMAGTMRIQIFEVVCCALCKFSDGRTENLLIGQTDSSCYRCCLLSAVRYCCVLHRCLALPCASGVGCSGHPQINRSPLS